MTFNKSWKLKRLGPCFLHSFEGQFEVLIELKDRALTAFLCVSEFN